MSLLKMTLNRNKKTSDAITGVLSFTHNGVEKKYNTLELLKEGNEEYYKSKTFRTCGTCSPSYRIPKGKYKVIRHNSQKFNNTLKNEILYDD